jgi:hypothetical protein
MLAMESSTPSSSTSSDVSIEDITSSVSVDPIIADILQLISPCEREAYVEMLESEANNLYEPVPRELKRQLAVSVWHRFTKMIRLSRPERPDGEA